MEWDDFVESSSENVVDIVEEEGYSSTLQIGTDTLDTAADVNEGEAFSNDLHDITESDNDNYITNADTNYDDLPMTAKVATWANKFNISHAAINSLLKILKPSFSDLPTDATTLLQSPRSYAVKTFSSGQYFHFGIAHGLEPMLSRLNLSTIQEVLLQFNVDGLPLCRSSNSQCWPIVCLIRKSPSKDPFVVGLFWAISLQLV